MPRATGSTGLRKGTASFIFFNVRTVDVQKRHCATDNVVGPVYSDARLPFVGGGDAEAGGGVPVFRTQWEGISTPITAHRKDEVLTFASDALSASEYFLALLAGGGLSWSSSSLLALLLLAYGDDAS